MSIKVAKTAGFCFGVKRTVDTASALSENHPGKRFYTLGKLIHNAHVVSRLEKDGVKVLSEKELFPVAESATAESPVVILIRAHGTLKENMERLSAMAEKNPALTIEDCTCPFVKKIHRIVEEHTSPATTLVVSGDPDHPEVRGIVSYAKGKTVVIPSVDSADFSELLCKIDKNDCIFVSQTTQKLVEWNKCKLFFKNYCTNPIFLIQYVVRLPIVRMKPSVYPVKQT